MLPSTNGCFSTKLDDLLRTNAAVGIKASSFQHLRNELLKLINNS